MTNEEMNDKGYCRRGGWGRKVFFIIPLVILGVFAMGALVMLLWNAIIPGLFPTLNIGTLTIWHALGLFLLSKILFSGFRGGHRGGWRHRRMDAAWKEKWMNMNDEEKAKFKEQWKERCRNRC